MESSTMNQEAAVERQERQGRSPNQVVDFIRKGGWLLILSLGLFLVGVAFGGMAFAEESTAVMTEYRDLPWIGAVGQRPHRDVALVPRSADEP